MRIANSFLDPDPGDQESQRDNSFSHWQGNVQAIDTFWGVTGAAIAYANRDRDDFVIRVRVGLGETQALLCLVPSPTISH
jgi:hypothetical protein